VAKAQGLSGTGSLRLGFAYLSRFYDTQRTVYIANPTWGNHKTIIKDSGLDWQEYTYYDKNLKGINIDAMCSDL